MDIKTLTVDYESNKMSPVIKRKKKKKFRDGNFEHKLTFF